MDDDAPTIAVRAVFTCCRRAAQSVTPTDRHRYAPCRLEGCVACCETENDTAVSSFSRPLAIFGRPFSRYVFATANPFSAPSAPRIIISGGLTHKTSQKTAKTSHYKQSCDSRTIPFRVRFWAAWMCNTSAPLRAAGRSGAAQRSSSVHGSISYPYIHSG